MTRTAALTRTSSSAISIPSTDRQRDVRDREDDGAQQRVPEDRVVQDRAVVREPDGDALVADQLEEAVALGRELDEPVERIAEDHRDRDDHRQRPARTGSPPAAFGARNGDAAGTGRAWSRRRQP